MLYYVYSWGCNVAGCNEREMNIEEWIVAFRRSGYDAEKAKAFGDTIYISPDMYYVERDKDFLENMPVRLVWEKDYDYPVKLSDAFRKKRPGVLFCIGNVAFLNKPSIFICGAREASDTGREIAYKCGRLAAEAGYVVISGYARGVDIAAHTGAVEGGGNTLALLPYGLARFSVRRELSELFNPDNFLVASELPPTCGFIVKGALRRNTLMVGLADAVIVIEPGESGGTWFSAERAADMKRPLFFHEGARPEIVPRMESMGGERLQVRNGAPVLDGVYERCGG